VGAVNAAAAGPARKGIKQVQVPAPGDLWNYFQKQAGRVDAAGC
jgi:hypothetical protein